MATKKVDASMLTEGQEKSYDIPAMGPVGTFKDNFDVVDRVNMSKADELAFLEEKVQIILFNTDRPDAEQVVELSNDGIKQFVIRGKPITIKRKFVEVLARAKSESISTPSIVDQQGNKTTRIVKASGLKYPFQVISDTLKGARWLEEILQEA